MVKTLLLWKMSQLVKIQLSVKNTTIMAGAFIGDNVKIGDNCVIYPNVTIYRDCVLGSDVMIHAGTVIGSDGFGFAHTKDGKYIKIYQNGNVVIGNDVEIGSNTAIDRAAFKSTIIEDGARIDNLVHIAHNCVIGKRFYYCWSSWIIWLNYFKSICYNGWTKCYIWTFRNSPIYNYLCSWRSY